MGQLVDVSVGDLITAQRQNDINDYIEDGVIRVKTLGLEVVNGELTDGTDTVTIAQMKSAYDGLIIPVPETKLGSDCSGDSGDENRVLTLNATPSTLFLVCVGGQVLFQDTDYTISGANITFLGKIFNTPKILIIYFT